MSRFINTGYGQCIYINGKLKGETNTWYKHLKIFNRKIEQYLGIVKIQLESEDTGEKGRQLTLAEYINLLKCTNDDYKHHGREIFTIYSSNKVNQQIIIDEDAIGIFVSDVRGMNNES